MKLKICGIRDKEGLTSCQALNVDYIGLNFVPTSKRRIMQALSEKQAGEPARVGVFQNQGLEFISAMVREYDLDVLQLHGAETAGNCKTLKQLCELPVWKAISADIFNNQDMLESYCNHCDLILFDGPNPGQGELIQNTDNLKVAIEFVDRRNTKIGMAGGINPSNIADFIAQYPNIDLLDTASGAERDGAFSAAQIQILAKNFNTAQKGMS